MSFRFEDLDTLADCGIRFNPYMAAEKHPLSIWSCDNLDQIQGWIKGYENEWREHRDEGKNLEYLCQKMTCTCFWNLREMLDNANLASPNVTIEKTDTGNGLQLKIKDSVDNDETQTYIAFIINNKVWMYLDDERSMEESLERMNIVCVSHGDSWENIKAKLNKPDPMTHKELLEVFASHPDIRDSIAKYPEKVFWPRDKVCKHCGKRIVSLYYTSPA